MSYNTQILGTGRYLPDKILSNKDIEKLVETSDQWIVERTGIRERRVADKNSATSDLAKHAALQAIEMAGIKPTDLDMILFATCTPDYFLPNTACVLQSKIGAGTCLAWDLNAACSGFLYGLSVANQYIRSGTYKNILVIGAEVLSRIVNYKDRDTCILFGDGAGAAVLGRAKTGRGIMAESLMADGNLGELLMLPGGGSKMPITHEVLDQGSHHMTMKGRDIFKNAVRTMSKCSMDVLSQCGLTKDDVDWVVPHQANQRIIEAIAKQMEIPMEKVLINIDMTGNTSAATVPIALDQFSREGKIKRGDLVLITVFGAGLTSGALLMEF